MPTIEYASRLTPEPGASAPRKPSILPLVLCCVSQTFVGIGVAFLYALFAGDALDFAMWWVCMGLTTLLYLMRRLHILIVLGLSLAVTVSPLCVMIHEVIIRGVSPWMMTWLVVAAVMDVIALGMGAEYRRPTRTIRPGSGLATDAWGNPR